MAMPVLACDHCTKTYRATRMVREEMLVPAPNAVNGAIPKRGNVLAAARTFAIVCEDHGERWVQIFGNHSTVLKARMRATFSTADVERLREVMPPDEFARFHDARDGWYIDPADESAIERWKQLSRER